VLRTLALPLLLLSGWASTARGDIPVRGRVLDAEKRPLAGAEVILVRSPTPWERLLLLLDGRVDPVPTARTKSEADGRFELIAPEADLWRVTVSAPGRVPMRSWLRPLLEETVLEPVTLVPDDPLAVRVVDGDGVPLPDIWVSAESASPDLWPPDWRVAWAPEPPRARTDAQGRVSLWRRAGERLDVDAHPPAAVPIRAAALRGPTTLRAVPTGSWTVRLLDADEVPVEGAIVALGRDPWPVGRTDAEGRFSAPRHPREETRLTFALADGRRARILLEPGAEPDPGGTPAALRDPVLVSGRVIDARTREGLAGAIVFSDSDPGLRTRTRAGGSFELLVPFPGSRGLGAAAAGHSPESTGDLRRPPLLALPPTWAVRGVVLDATGAPVADAEVLAFPRLDDGRRLSSAFGSSVRRTSRADGAFELAGLRDQLTYTVVARLADLGEAEETVRPDEAERLVHLVLSTGAGLTGQLLDGSDAPVGGATLRLQRSLGGTDPLAWSSARVLDPRGPLETTSDEQGSFSWEHLPPGTWDLAVRAGGYAEEAVPGIELEEGRTRDLGLLHLTAGTALEGRVQDPDGAPLAGAQIFLSMSSAFFFSADEPAPDSISDTDGWFSIPDLRAGAQVDLEVRCEGFVRRTLPGVVVARELLSIELAPAARLAGVVLGEDGAAVSGAFVTAHQEAGTAGPGGRVWADLPLSHAPTDADGRFELEELPSGRLRLLVRADGWMPEERTGIEVGTGTVESLTIRLRRGAAIEGRVVAADGSPVSDAAVDVVESSGRGFRGVRSDGDGRYRLEGVEPGQRVVGASAEDGRSTTRELEVIEGTNTLDLVFEPGWPVAGVVVDAAGAPVADALLTLATDSTAWGGLDARSDDRGAFRFEEVREGTYWLRGRHRRYAMTRLEDPLEVAGPVAGVELRLAAGTRVVGTLSGLDEVELRQVVVMAHDARTGMGEGRVSPNGDFVIPALASGEWTVLASTPRGRRVSERVSITSGEEEVRVDLSFGDGFTLTGTVLLAGEPLTGARLVLRNQDIADSAWSRTDHLGRFEAHDLEPGRYGIVVSDFESGLHHQEEVLLLDDEEVLIEIDRYRVSGRVVDARDDRPIVGASIRLQPANVDPALLPTSTRGPGTRSDSSGGFSMGTVAAGDYGLSASKDGYARLDRSLPVGPGDVEDVVLRLEPTDGLEIRVLMPDGRPARQVSVVALDPLSGQPIDGGSLPATSDGDVRLQSLPAGRWTLVVVSGDAAVGEITLSSPGERETLRLGPGTRLEVIVGSLTGPVVPAATLFLQRPTGESFRHPGSGELRGRWSLWNGRATVENLPPGAWIVRVEATDGRRWDETVAVQAGGAQSVEID